MSFFNYIPGVAHVKAGVHLICNDKEGAKKTWDTFHTKTPLVSHLVAGIAKVAGDDELAKKAWDGGNSSLNALPVVGHVKGLGHYVCGDIEGGNQAMKDATVTTSNIADGIPGVGHVKGVVHYACGDVDGGNKAMKASTRTTAVMVAGAGGFVVGGPVGAVAGGVTAGSGWDLTAAVVTDGKEASGIAKIITNPTSVDAYFDAGFCVVGDALAGHAGGNIAKKAMGLGKPGAIGGGQKAAAAAQQLVDDLDAGKINFNEYQQKWDAIKPQGVPVKMNADQLNFHFEKGFIAEQQFNQAKREMAKTGSNQATVVMASSTEGQGSNSGKRENQKGDKDQQYAGAQPPDRNPPNPNNNQRGNCERSTNQQQTQIEVQFETVFLRNGTRVDRISRVEATIRAENIRPRGAQHQSWTRTNPNDHYIFDVLDGIRGVDERGHLIAGSLGGSGTDRNNIVPMSRTLNNGAYKMLESEVLNDIQNLQNQYPGQRIEARIAIDVRYPSGDTARPSGFSYKIDFYVNGHHKYEKGGLFSNQ